MHYYREQPPRSVEQSLHHWVLLRHLLLTPPSFNYPTTTIQTRVILLCRPMLNLLWTMSTQIIIGTRSLYQPRHTPPLQPQRQPTWRYAHRLRTGHHRQFRLTTVAPHHRLNHFWWMPVWMLVPPILLRSRLQERPLIMRSAANQR